jgi:hypothetical protein
MVGDEIVRLSANCNSLVARTNQKRGFDFIIEFQSSPAPFCINDQRAALRLVGDIGVGLDE